MISGPYEPAYLMKELQAGVPYFAESVPLPNGLAERPGTESLWGMIDGEQACALFLFVHPADAGVMVKIIDQVREVGQFTLTAVNLGEVDPIIAHSLVGAEPYPVQNVLAS